jgi:precorrin-2/cobalt-factor-2 C20-methyltransferase
MRQGIVHGVGIGPGDPELITLKALRLIRSAPVLAYPAPEGGESFVRRIVSSWISPAKIEIVLEVPMLADRFPADAAYERAMPEIAAHLEAGRDVAVLCQGDPFFYGSFMYLFARLATCFTVEIVPGVSSLAACAAAARMPLAARNDTVAILPAPLAEAELEQRITGADAAAIIKLGRHFAKVRNILGRLGLLDKARYVERATLASQRVLPLAEVDPETVPYFAMILVHKRGSAERVPEEGAFGDRS